MNLATYRTHIACLAALLILNGAGQAHAVMLGDQLFKLTADDGAADDAFGASVDISEDIAIVGARLNDDAGSDSGSAYLFDVTTGDQLFKLTANDAAAEDQFGVSVGISGNSAIVRAFHDDDFGFNLGSAYLFDVTTGDQLFKLTAGDLTAAEGFGWSVGISGNTAIVGAPFVNLAGNNKAGEAYLFDVTTGDLLFKLTADDAAASDQFGFSVGISGNIAIVGRADQPSGSAYLFDVTSGDQLFKLTTSDPLPVDGLGRSVAINGNTAISGAPFTFNNAAAYSFDAATGSELLKIIPNDPSVFQEFGISVDISGTMAIVGAIFDDDAGTDAGAAYLFDVTSGSQLVKLKGNDTAAGDYLGASAAITENTAIVGVPRHDGAGENAGAAYIFATVPEPSTMALLSVLVLIFFRVARKRRTVAS